MACIQSCMTSAAAACPNLLDMGCVCKPAVMDAFACCVETGCDMGAVGDAAFGMVKGMCGSSAGSSLTCNKSGSYGKGGSPVFTPIPTAKSPGKRPPVYTTAPAGGYGGAVFAPGAGGKPTASSAPPPYAALKQTSGSPTVNKKSFGVAGLLSLGMGAMLLVSCM